MTTVIMIVVGISGRERADDRGERAPRTIWPSPPMLITLARNAMVMPTPTKRSGVALRIVEVIAAPEPNAPVNMAFAPSSGFAPENGEHHGADQQGEKDRGNGNEVPEEAGAAYGTVLRHLPSTRPLLTPAPSPNRVSTIRRPSCKRKRSIRADRPMEPGRRRAHLVTGDRRRAGRGATRGSPLAGQDQRTVPERMVHHLDGMLVDR